jgi:hypothetical protein
MFVTPIAYPTNIWQSSLKHICPFVILLPFVWWCILIADSLILADPSLYLPALVRLVYSPDENQSSASDAIVGVLKRHNQNIEIIFLVVDCLKYVFFFSLLFPLFLLGLFVEQNIEKHKSCKLLHLELKNYDSTV